MTAPGEGQIEMSMLVVHYLQHHAEYRAQTRPPPPEFVGLPPEIIPIIVATGTSGNYNVVMALLAGLSTTAKEFIHAVLVLDFHREGFEVHSSAYAPKIQVEHSEMLCIPFRGCGYK